jgi:Porin subfamily
MFRTITAAAALLAFAAPALAGDKTDPRCSQYGEGFAYSADTGMCIKVSGELRADYGFGHAPGIGRQTGFGSSVKGQVDMRGDSDLGPFRAVIEPTARKF